MSKKQLLNESWLKMFGEWNKQMLKYIYGDDVKMRAQLDAHKMIYEDEEESTDNQLSFSIVGEEADVKSYANAIMMQKNYLETHIQCHLDLELISQHSSNLSLQKQSMKCLMQKQY